jgi:hypothetical protein
VLELERDLVPVAELAVVGTDLAEEVLFDEHEREPDLALLDADVGQQRIARRAVDEGQNLFLSREAHSRVHVSGPFSERR